MDAKDMDIVGILREEGRASIASIARRTGLSESAVRNRMSKLERDGIIVGYTAVLDPAKLGFGSVAYLGIDAEPERYLEVVRALRGMPEVRWVAAAAGDHSIMAEVWLEDDAALARFLRRKVGRIAGVTRVCPAIVQERMG